MLPRKLYATANIALLLLMVIVRPSLGQELDPHDAGEEHKGSEPEHHPNHFGGLVGLTTHHDTDDSGPTLGLEYARRIATKWAIGGFLELVSSSNERDIVFGVGCSFFPIRRLGIMLGPGVEAAEKEVPVGGDEVETEAELELMIRVGIAYEFELTPEAHLVPAVFLDWAGGRWTSLIGIGMSVGF